MRYRRRWCNIAVVIGSIAIVACVSEPEGGTAGTGASAIGSPQASSVAIPAGPTFNAADSASRTAALTYAGGATFVTDSRLVDEQVLRRPGGTGPRARVEATTYSHLLTDAQLARGALVAKFVSDGEYTPLGLNRGVQYLFVDSVAGAGWRAIVVDSASPRAPKVLNLVLADTPHDYSVPSARWVESVGFTIANPSCGRYCCIPCDSARGYSCPSGPWPPRLDPDEMIRTRTTMPAVPPRVRAPGR